MGQGPIENGSTDSLAVYRELNDLRTSLNEFKAFVASSAGGTTGPGVLQAPAACVPFIVERKAKKHGEKVTMCFQWPAGEDVQRLNATVWMFNTAGNAFEEKFDFTFKDIDDDNRKVGSYSGQFGPRLPFNRVFALTRIKVFDEQGAITKTPADDPATHNPPPVNYTLTIFTTGSPGLNGPAAHNLFRNGRCERSKYNWTNSADPKPDRKQLECFGWFVNCDRNRPITAAGSPPHPTPSVDPSWDKANGRIQWSSVINGISQRLPQRPLRADDIAHALTWLSQPLAVNPIVADLTVTLVSVIDTRAVGGFLTLNRLVSFTFPQVGGAGGGGFGPVEKMADDLEAALQAAPDSIIDPGPPIEELFSTTRPLQCALQVPGTYTLSQTPDPTGGDSSGQWILFELSAKSGTGQFGLDRFRSGLGDGDFTFHSQELQAGDDADAIGPPDVTNGGGRGGGVGYGQSDTSFAPGRGGILRPNSQ